MVEGSSQVATERRICEQGLEHHMAANHSETARSALEAATKYLGWDVYWQQ